MSGVAQDSHAKLARMAHQIADFFRSYPQDEASRAIADHINHFWTPRMRSDFPILQSFSSGGANPSAPASI